jgi:hypothetical protein
MKKIIIIFSIAFLAIGALSAQGWGPRSAPESVKIEGTLQLHKGQFAVASGNNIYYVPRISRYVGFIDGLKEGSNVSFEGYVAGNFLQPVKMTISGKSYDLAGDRAGRNNNFMNRNNRNWGLNDRGFNGFGPGGCCVPYGGNGRGRR